MNELSPGTELLLAAYGADRSGMERLARAVAGLNGLMLAPHVVRLRDAAAAWLAAPEDGALYQGLHAALATYCEREAPRSTRITAVDYAALADEPPAWTGRADLQ